MKLLHVHSGNLFGGVETMLLSLKRFEPAELSQTYALCWDGQLSRELAELGAVIARLPEVRLRSPGKIFRARRALIEHLQTARPDVVLFHSAWAQLLFAPVVHRLGVPFARYLHGIPARSDLLDRLAMRHHPAVVLTAGTFTASHARKVYPHARHVTVRYPVDIDNCRRDPAARARLRNAIGVADDEKVILQISRMESWKGQRLHLRALGRVDRSLPWKMWMVGGAQRPEERAFVAELKLMAKELGIADRITFLGHRTDVRSLLSAADIFCQPNEGPEPFGIVFIEALASELPVVSTNMGGAAEILENTGRLVPPNARALAVALTDLVRSAEARQTTAFGALQRASSLCDAHQQSRALVGALQSSI